MKYIANIFSGLLYPALLFLLIFPLHALGQQVEMKDGFFYLDDQKFFVKGIGYEVGALPGQLPWDRPFKPEVIHFDMERILSGGFNTIRTWAIFTEEELDVVAQHDIKIIQGIWIDPHADFSDPNFVNTAKDIVSDMLSYSKNYDNIIAYLIMNEPLPETIANAGYNETVTLWQQLIDIIHTEHPGRPVSISNSSNGTYIDAAVFDFSAFNVYIYNPVTVNFLHRYRDYVEYLVDLKNNDQPLIITEYGLSVSPVGPGNWGYGGNSLDEQVAGNLHMYQSLVNGGASGSCMFNYSDGWWKGGNENVHDDHAEEWFGLVEYNSLSDDYGQVRPIWNAVRDYQSAIITQPRSAEIYDRNIPLEIFGSDTITRVIILLEGDTIYQSDFETNYLADTLLFNAVNTTDAVLIFEFYGASGQLIKSEEKNILITPTSIELPIIDITVENINYWRDGFVNVRYQIDQSPDLSAGTLLDHIFYPHVGFNYGESFQWPLPMDDHNELSESHSFNSTVNAITLGAAFDVTYGNFEKRIVNQLTLSRFEGVPTGIEEVPGLASYIGIKPNPANDVFVISNHSGSTLPSFNYAVVDAKGAMVMPWRQGQWDVMVDAHPIPPGAYFLLIQLDGEIEIAVKKLAKF